MGKSSVLCWRFPGEEIERYLQERGQGFCTDSTNLSDNYTRNRLRRNILPELEESVNRQSRMHIAQAGERIRRAQEYLEGLAARRAGELSEYCGEELRVLAKDFCREEEVMQEYMLRIWLDRPGAGMKDVGAVHLEEIKRLAAEAQEKPVTD